MSIRHSFLILILIFSLTTKGEDFSHGKWRISHNTESHLAKIMKNGKPLLHDVTPQFKVVADKMRTEKYDNISYITNNLIDEVGAGKKFLVTYSTADPSLTDVTLVGKNGAEVSSNYIAPVVSETPNIFLPQDMDNRFLTVPFDNDGFIEYGYFPLSCSFVGSQGKEAGRVARDSISFEVTAIFNAKTDEGLVVGSVDHDTWKSAIKLQGSPLSQGAINRIECISGITHNITHNTMRDYLQPHGTVTANKVKSARMMLHYSDDWCNGMETFGEVCAQIAGKANYDAPYG